MYESFFGFEEKPFSLTPNTKYLYLCEQNEQVLKTLLFGIESNAGFMLLSGEAGSGKTTLVRAMLGVIGEDIETCLVLNPLLSTLELLQSINRDFGNICRSTSIQKQLETLNDFLLKLNAQGKKAVVIIDEAQNLSFEAFEMTRMLSNLETESQKLLNIIFVGQPELVKLINQSRLRQLAQRIQIHAELDHFTLQQTQNYILHRIQCAGAKVSTHFENSAIKTIFKKSGGIPRIINNICEYVLLTAYCQNTRIIDRHVMGKALKEVPGYVYYS